MRRSQYTNLVFWEHLAYRGRIWILRLLGTSLETLSFHPYRVIETGEYFCADDETDSYAPELLGFEEELTIKQMITMGIIEQVDYNGNLPAIETSYIKGEMRDPEYKKISHLTFINGRPGAGITISLGGDGTYPVYIEYYKHEMQRIIIDI